MLWGILGFLITIGLLVTIHEWGHFWVARRFDVKIVRFSLGFGKPFYTWRGKKDGTLYTLAPIPLGGFVQMLGETPDEPVAAAEKHRTFQAKPAWQRFLIAFAGPAVNLIFAVLAFAALFLYGVEGLRPEIAFVQPSSLAAEAGFQRGDIIESVDGHTVKLSNDAHIALISAPRASEVPVVIRRDGHSDTLFINLSGLQKGDELDMSRATGLFLVDNWLPATVGEVIQGSAAAKMGLQAGDEITAFDGVQPVDIVRISERIRASAVGQSFSLTVNRAGQAVTLAGTFGSRDVGGQTVPFLGVKWQPIPLGEYRITERYGLLPALGHGWDKMLYYIRITYDMFGKMITGKVSLDNVGGPITIGDAAGKTLRYGADVFLNFLGLISLSLAAINLLPIPMLDGGHMLFYAVEMIRGKPLSEKTMAWSFRIGAAFVYMFMGFVVFKDLVRYVF